MSEERVLILLPAYNQESTIAECIESVIKQSHSNWILVCQDDYSKDNTFKIIQTYSSLESRIIPHKQAKNMGLSGNWNSLAIKSLAKFESEYVCWLAGDDYWSEIDYLKNLIAGMKDSGRSISSPSYQKVSIRNEKIQEPFTVKLESSNKLKRVSSLLNWNLGGLTILYALYKRDHFETVFFKGGAPSLYPGSDFWWAYAAVLNQNAINVPSSTFCKRTLTFDKHNIKPERTHYKSQKPKLFRKLSDILWKWKLQASLFQHLIINERKRFVYFKDWSITVIILGIFFLTIFNIARFPIDGLLNRLKHVK